MKTRQKIEAFLQENPTATYREIMAAVELKSTSAVHFHMDNIKRPTGKERLKQLVAQNKKMRAALEYALEYICCGLTEEFVKVRDAINEALEEKKK